MWPTIALLALALALLAAGAWWRERQRHARTLTELAHNRQREEAAESVAARQSRARRNALFDSMSDGVLLLDARGKIELMNAAFRRLFGLPAEGVGRKATELVRHPRFTALLETAARTGQALDEEIELTGVARTSLQLSATTLREPGKADAGTVVVAHDLTRLKRLENTRREFVANVSHELRTPLSVIKGSVETLLEGARDDPEISLRFLRTIEKHADRLAFLIEDLLTISRLEAGSITLQREEVRLRDLVERVFDDLRESIRRKPLQLENLVPEDLSAQADKARLQQVLVNLVENAIKYGHDGGHVWVEAHGAGPRWVEVQVRDDGPGIPAESLERIYERFYRVDKARSREQGGTGLGLAIVKHIVQSHGGEVRTESELGTGSVFRFTLPAPEAAEPPAG